MLVIVGRVLDRFREVTIAIELLVAGAALRVVFVSFRHRHWVGTLRAAALATFVIDAVWVTRERIGSPHLNWTTPVNLVASVAAIVGFALTEIRIRRGEEDRF